MLPSALHPASVASIHIPDVSGSGGSPAVTMGACPIGFAAPVFRETQRMLRAGPRRCSPGPIPAAASLATSSMSQLGFDPAIKLASRLIQIAT